MSWWGKLIGGTFGFMLGGPIGAMLGAALGHNFDQGLGSFTTNSQYGAGPDVDVERLQSIFFTTTFSVMGYLAKADGQVSPEEIRLAESVMQQMRLNPQQKKVAVKLFNEGKSANFPFQQVLLQFRQECHRRRHLLQMFMEILTATALADGSLHPSESALLQSIAGSLGFSRAEFAAILQRQKAGQHMHQQGPDSATALNDAYKLLGVPKTATAQEVKLAYRRLMNQHHPDKLVAKGLPEEMMALANQKTMDIKAAYELIKGSR